MEGFRENTRGRKLTKARERAPRDEGKAEARAGWDWAEKSKPSGTTRRGKEEQKKIRGNGIEY